ncbi:MAG: hypothetical protein ACJ780_08730 [Solirubrobacteraceae bacterium]
MADSEGNSCKIGPDPDPDPDPGAGPGHGAGPGPARGPEVEVEIMALARAQQGHVARWQLVELGVRQGLIAGRLKSGEWSAPHAGVYCIGPRRDDPVSRAAGAVLACGPTAVLSHGSAASIWGFWPRWTFPLEVTSTSRRTRPGITTHRCRTLKPGDTTRQLGIPSTSPERTILDLAPRLTARKLTRMVNDARLSGHLHLAALRDVLTRNPLHPGSKPLKPFAEDAANPTRSTFEDEFLAFIEKHGLPTPLVNTTVNGYEVDVFFPQHDLIVELDGWEFHRDRKAFGDDRERDAENLRAGLRTVRVTRERIEHTADREAARLQRILDQSRAF